MRRVWKASTPAPISNSATSPAATDGGPLHGQTINSDRPRFRWAGARCAQQRAADCRRAELRATAAGTKHPGTDLRLAQPLPPGQYFWRVASRDGNGHQGRYGQALPLQLSNEPVDRPCSRLRPRVAN